MWHPETESMACCDLSALLEWLRATQGRNDLTPQSLQAWRAHDPQGFAQACGSYAQLAERGG